MTQVNVALEALNKNSLDVFDDNQFVDISKKIYDTIHDIRCSVMMIRVSLLYVSLNYRNIRYQLECLECLQEMFYFDAIMSMLKSIKIEKFICIPKVRSTVTSNTFTCVFGYNLCK